jgi:hypothetical protein
MQRILILLGENNKRNIYNKAVHDSPSEIKRNEYPDDP